MHDRLLALGLRRLETVLDIGAHDGTWAQEARRAFPGARVLSFEANPAHATALAAAGLEHRICLLGARANAPATFWARPHGGTGDSVFREVGGVYAGVEPVVIPTARLDDLPEVRALPGIDLMKLDVQGSELEVLRGAEDALARTEVVVLEASLFPYNHGAPLAAEAVGFMAARGFELIGVVGANAVNGVCAQLDLAFARRGSAVFAGLAARVAGA